MRPDPSAILEEVATQWLLPGVALVLFSPDGMQSISFGRNGGAHNLPTVGRTLFPLASVTKTFTAELVAHAVSEGHLDWDQPIRDLLPAFRLEDSRATHEMTVRDAACHRSGLPPHTWAWVFGDVDRRRFVLDRLPHLAMSGCFSHGYRYSNILYAVLGLLLENLQGRSWEHLVTGLFEDTRMRDTELLTEAWAESSPHVAAPHDRDGDEIPPFVAAENHLIAPASEVMGSMEDLARWGQYMLRLDTEREPWTPQVLIGGERKLPDLGPLHYGLGWRIETFQGRKHVWHSGQCSGYTTMLSLLPESQQGLAIATNQSGAISALYAVVYALLGKEETERVLRAFPAPRPRHEPSRKTEAAAPPKTLTPRARPGVFRNEGYGTFEIENVRGNWSASFQRGTAVPLRWISEREAYWNMPVYGISFLLSWEEDGGGFLVPFESLAPPIYFARIPG